MRPTGLGGGIDKDRQDFTICGVGWAVGRIGALGAAIDRLGDAVRVTGRT
jgi:hypothetical protein